MKVRGTATDRLVDVMQMLVMLQKTGILTAQREISANTLEEAALYIRDGQIVNASVGNMRGTEALKKINTWTKCYFIFQAGVPSGQTSLLSPLAVPFEQIPGASAQEPSLYSSMASSIIPRRSEQFLYRLPDFDSLKLSRIHRQLFLLTDGQRSVEHLARLLRHPQQEILSLLADMEKLNLLRYS